MVVWERVSRPVTFPFALAFPFASALAFPFAADLPFGVAFGGGVGVGSGEGLAAPAPAAVDDSGAASCCTDARSAISLALAVLALLYPQLWLITFKLMAVKFTPKHRHWQPERVVGSAATHMTLCWLWLPRWCGVGWLGVLRRGRVDHAGLLLADDGGVSAALPLLCDVLGRAVGPIDLLNVAELTPLGARVHPGRAHNPPVWKYWNTFSTGPHRPTPGMTARKTDVNARLLTTSDLTQRPPLRMAYSAAFLAPWMDAGVGGSPPDSADRS